MNAQRESVVPVSMKADAGAPHVHIAQNRSMSWRLSVACEKKRSIAVASATHRAAAHRTFTLGFPLLCLATGRVDVTLTS